MFFYGAAVCLIIAVWPFAWRKGVQWVYGRSIYTTETAPTDRVVIVFGAAVYGSGRGLVGHHPAATRSRIG